MYRLYNLTLELLVCSIVNATEMGQVSIPSIMLKVSLPFPYQGFSSGAKRNFYGNTYAYCMTAQGNLAEFLL